MDIESLRTFFLWCTVINGGLFILSWLFSVGALGWVYRMHSRFYPLTREQFNVAMYAFIGAFKLFWLGFNLVPYLALVLMG